jgi:hypothetical protein
MAVLGLDLRIDPAISTRITFAKGAWPSDGAAREVGQ